jgi:hypothetical protein
MIWESDASAKLIKLTHFLVKTYVTYIALTLQSNVDATYNVGTNR